MKRWLILMLAGIALAGAAGPAAMAAGKLETVKFQDYPGLGNLLVRVARSKGWCESAGIDCKMEMIPSAPLGVQALIGGSIDVAEAPIDVTAAAVLRGSKIKAVVGSAVSNFFIVIASNNLVLPDEAKGFPAVMADLKGKKVGVVARGSATENLFSHLLEAAGMKADDVTYVAVGAPNTAYPALVNRQVDAVVSWEPAGIMCELSRQCHVLWRGATAPEPADLRAMYGAGTSLVMRDDYLDRHPQVADAIVAVCRKAEAFVNNPANMGEVLKISDSYYRFDMPHGDVIARRVLQMAIDTRTYHTMVKRDAVAATLKYLAETRQIPAMPAVADLVWNKAPDQ